MLGENRWSSWSSGSYCPLDRRTCIALHGIHEICRITFKIYFMKLCAYFLLKISSSHSGQQEYKISGRTRNTVPIVSGRVTTSNTVTPLTGNLLGNSSNISSHAAGSSAAGEIMKLPFAGSRDLTDSSS